MNTLEIKLKNGEKLNLEVTPLLLEYVEDYKGGIEQLRKDAQGNIDENGYTKTMYATNQLLYAIIASNYVKALTYRQAVRLVNIEDTTRIIEFINENISGLKENKEKNADNIFHRI